MHKKLLNKMICLMAVCIFMTLQCAFAEDMNVTVNDDGLKAEPTGASMFYEDNYDPGDEVYSHINVKNNYEYPVDVYMKAERIGNTPLNQEADLYKQLVLTVDCGNEELYRGPMNGFDGKSIFIGKLQSGDYKNIVASVSLPGAETGNRYQDKKIQSKWIFSATPEVTAVGSIPKTGEATYLILYFTSAALIASGIILSKKHK